MTDYREKVSAPSAPARRHWHRREMALVLTILLGLGGTAALAHWMEKHRPPESTSLETEELYMTPEATRRMSLGFNGLIADWYWMRALQYVGRKIDAYHGAVQIDNLSPLGIKLLGPLLERATTLDPQFMAAYEYGATVLPAVDVEAAINLTKKGIAANPQAWRLYQHLGYIYWQRGRFREASEAYSAGAKIPNAPSWMAVLAARMEAEGGSRSMAREMYMHIYTEVSDEQVKHLAYLRLLQLRSLEERDVICRVLADYSARMGRCPSAWREIAAALHTARFDLDPSGAPLDPSGVAYVLTTESCDVALDARSKIPRR